MSPAASKTPSPQPQDTVPSADPFAQLPTETEIYILPNGEIIVADMPAELEARLATTTPSSLDQPKSPSCQHSST